MDKTPHPARAFEDGCPDRGRRTITLPPALPSIPDDIDLNTRDYDGFRLTMLEDLASRFPDRRRWTPGDIEVVLVEVLAAALDELSHDLDRLQREAYLETARNPASVRRLLAFIGYDAGARQGASKAELDRDWLFHPQHMEAARVAGPRQIHTNRRMVTRDDHAARLNDHPLILAATATTRWTGSWTAVDIAVVPVQGRKLDTPIASLIDAEAIKNEITAFHARENLARPFFSDETTIRVALRWMVEAERMIGRQAVLHDARDVPIFMALSARIDQTYFESEVRRAIEEVLGTKPGGFFAPGNLALGEDLRLSEIFQVVGSIDGVKSVCVNRFKRLGKQFPDRSDSGAIILDGVEVAVCKNSGDPNGGLWTLNIHGGNPG